MMAGIAYELAFENIGTVKSNDCAILHDHGIYIAFHKYFEIQVLSVSHSIRWDWYQISQCIADIA